MNDQPTPKSRFRWANLVLIISLSLNVAIVAFIGGVISQRHPMGREPGAVADFLQAMPPEHREAMQAELRTRGDDWRRVRGELRGLREDFAQIVRSEPLDVDALEEALAKQRELATGITEQAHRELVRRLSAMSYEERVHFLERLGPVGRPGRPGP